MKSVLISIQPKWCELIASGKKTVEVRKTAPKLQTPFKCYIYATKPKKFIKGYADDDLFRHIDGRIECGFSYQLALEEGATPENNILSGKIIGEFVCDRIDEIKDYTVGIGKEEHYLLCGGALEGTCLTGKEMYDYGKGKPLYGWHISDLKIYDNPKELGEFKTPSCEKSERYCEDCKFKYHDYNGEIYCKDDNREITRPPQSWRYVEG